MAGIGFRLVRLLEKQTYRGALQAYGYAAVVGSGPWVLSMATLGVLGMVLRARGLESELELFFASVTHVFAFSLVATGPLQLIISRYAADCLYAKNPRAVFPAYLGALTLALAAGAAIGGTFFLVGLAAVDSIFRLAAMGLLMTVSAIWISTVFLSAVKDYNAVLWCFAVGYLVSFGGAWVGGQVADMAGVMTGFLLGQVVLLLLLLTVIFREFGVRSGPDFQFLKYFRQHWTLAGCGLAYNVGIWIDKPLYWWFSSHGYQVSGWLWAAPIYDEAVYLSFLSVAPGMAVFLLTVETTFAQHYAQFFQQVVDKASLRELLETKALMVEALQDGVTRLLKYQGAFTLLLVVQAGPLLDKLGLGSVQTLVFQVTLVGVFLLVVLLALLTVLFYLDRLAEALRACLIMAVVNGVGSLIGILMDERWYGMGFTAGAAIAVVYAMGQANYWLSRLDYETFTSEPLYPKT